MIKKAGLESIWDILPNFWTVVYCISKSTKTVLKDMKYIPTKQPSYHLLTTVKHPLKTINTLWLQTQIIRSRGWRGIFLWQPGKVLALFERKSAGLLTAKLMWGRFCWPVLTLPTRLKRYQNTEETLPVEAAWCSSSMENNSLNSQAILQTHRFHRYYCVGQNGILFKLHSNTQVSLLEHNGPFEMLLCMCERPG